MTTLDLMSPNNCLTSTGEARALLGGRGYPPERSFLLAICLAVFGFVAGTYYWFSLLPAFENDVYLNWNPRVTMLVATSAFVAENIGYLLLGPLADSMSPTLLLGFQALFMIVATVYEIMCRQAWQLSLTITLVCFVKGLLWPAICALISLNIAPSRQDVAFLISALGSRLAETTTKLFLGRVMSAPLGLGWRSTVAVLLLLIILAMAFAVLLCPPIHVDAIKREPDERVDTECMGKWRRLVSSPEAWLQWFILVSSGMIWSLNSYVGLLLYDVNGTSIATASSATSAIPAGMAIGLIVGMAASAGLGSTASRSVHVLQIVAGAAALAGLAIYPTSQLRFVFGLLFLAGFGAVVPAYLPSLRYAASSPPGERAFRLSALWATNAFIGAGVTFYFGSLRTQDMEASVVATCMYGSTAMGVLIAGLLLAATTWVVPDAKDSNEKVDELQCRA